LRFDYPAICLVDLCSVSAILFRQLHRGAVQLGWNGLHAGERLFRPLPKAFEGIIPQAIKVIHVLPLGIGTNKWRRADRGAVLETYRTIHDAGPCMIDTAEIYFSERVVSDCLRAGPIHAVIASKSLPFPGRTSPRRLMSALDGSLARLGLKLIDLYYVHYPLPLIDVGVFAEGLVEAVKSGKARAVGVANFNADQMRRIADHLARAGVPLAANQVNYSLLRRAAETNGVLEACRELDVALVAYFPLASGRLTQPSDSMDTKALLKLHLQGARC
jgi:aryl-alcohol dehydrogenase-like predicted oxidoreductase